MRTAEGSSTARIDATSKAGLSCARAAEETSVRQAPRRAVRIMPPLTRNLGGKLLAFRVAFDQLEFHAVGSLDEGRAHAIGLARAGHDRHPFALQPPERPVEVVHAEGHVIERAAAIRGVAGPPLPLPA